MSSADREARPTAPGTDTPRRAGGRPLEYRAFISYSHADRKFARWRMAKLEGYRVPKRLVGKETPIGPVPPNRRRIFRDRDELASASDLGDRIRSVITGSGAPIVCARASTRSVTYPSTPGPAPDEPPAGGPDRRPPAGSRARRGRRRSFRRRFSPPLRRRA